MAAIFDKNLPIPDKIKKTLAVAGLLDGIIAGAFISYALKTKTDLTGAIILICALLYLTLTFFVSFKLKVMIQVIIGYSISMALFLFINARQAHPFQSTGAELIVFLPSIIGFALYKIGKT